ncbi:glycosyl hydrolase [Niabella ginsenosidivorans]|uniref:exo-alpha-sialidase n=1 Tax=Niabella ginsenosidivorans TaxID=1176587 RepID=A0A1A9I7L4_9BACT|nr:sialidase family protein [Niabella ginsenosidivorans]ANH83039.1 glycosyl hydrolase [Niabella ginsenosidivorans]
MNKIKSLLTAARLAVLFFIPAISNAQGTKADAEVLNYRIPVFKRVDENPVQRVRIFIPGGSLTAKQLVINTDAASASLIDKIRIFNTRNEPVFSGKGIPVNIQPVAGKNAIPINDTLAPGLNYLWVSVLLKEQAPVDKKVQLSTHTIILSNGSSLPIRAGNQLEKGWYTGIRIRKPGDDSVNTYRIPGIVRTDKNTLIAVYDVRYKNDRDLPADIDIGMSRSTDNGETWEPMKIIMSMGKPGENSGIGDPAVLFDPAGKKIWVAGLWSKGNRSIAGSEPGLSPDVSGQFVLVCSADDGKTWSAPINITSQVKNPAWHLYFQGPGNGIAMQNGTLVFASQYWDETKKPGIPHGSVIYSMDHGKTWKSGIGAKSNTTESQVIETTPGTLMLNMRDNRGGFRSVATTKDMGKTWLEHPTSYEALPDPVCMASIIKASVKIKGVLREVVFFSNMNNSDARKHLTIKASLDLGATWLPAHQLLIDERKAYGYSALVQVDEETLGVLYEGIRDLNFVKIPVADIIN